MRLKKSFACCFWLRICLFDALMFSAVASFSQTPASAIRYGQWKLIVHYETGSHELFNLENDVKEENNVYKKHKTIAKELMDKMGDYLQKTTAFIPTQKNKFYSKN